MRKRNEELSQRSTEKYREKQELDVSSLWNSVIPIVIGTPCSSV